MKFGKSLSNQIEETLPEWRDKFLSYKDLKKRLKLIDPPPTLASSSSIAAAAGRPPPHKRPRPAPTTTGHEQAMTAEEEGFVTLLEAELDKFNTFFVEKEEEYIIRQKELQDRLRTSKDSRKEMMKVRKEIVDFHGEMVLLENYSALNYTGLVKILKKYDKRTGALLRLPFIQRVLQQPFFTTDVLDQLIKQCETMHDGLLPDPSSLLQHQQQQQPGGAAATTTTEEGPPRRIPELEEIEYMESLYMKSTLAALRALREIRSRSSTVSVFSLPPLQTSGAVDTRWPTINISPVLQQAAD